MSIRPVKSIVQSKPTLEGAGVRLRRAFGFGDTTEFDPFLLFDDFRGDNPADFIAGFPWHPHRGIETITYVLAGKVDHGDSLGNRGTLGDGDVQWMTAGRGIMHQEMPKGDAQGRMREMHPNPVMLGAAASVVPSAVRLILDPPRQGRGLFLGLPGRLLLRGCGRIGQRRLVGRFLFQSKRFQAIGLGTKRHGGGFVFGHGLLAFLDALRLLELNVGRFRLLVVRQCDLLWVKGSKRDA